MKKLFVTAQLIVVVMLGVWIYNNVYSQAQAEQKPAQGVIEDKTPITVYSAIYIAPLIDNIASPLALSELNIAVVHNETELTNRLALQNKIAVIYIHPDTLADVDATWLQAQYASGVAVVAINTPISKLAAMLQAATPLQDLPIREDRMFIAGFTHGFDAETQAIDGDGSITEYFGSFTHAVGAINGTLMYNGKK